MQVRENGVQSYLHTIVVCVCWEFVHVSEGPLCCHYVYVNAVLHARRCVYYKVPTSFPLTLLRLSYG